MRRFVIFALAFSLTLSFAAVVLAHTVEHAWEQIALDGTFITQKNGVRFGDLVVKFDDKGLNFLRYRVAPLRGMVRVLDVTVVVGDKAVYRRSQTHPMNVDLSWAHTPAKHYQETVAFDAPIPGFNHETGQIVFNVAAEGKKYNVTWSMKDNEFKTTEVVENLAAPAAPAVPPAPVPAAETGK